VYGVIYFVIFYVLIRVLNLKTPGREDDDEIVEEASAEHATGDKYHTMAVQFIDALGGKENITSIDNCATRLRLEIADSSLINENALKKSGARGVMRMSKSSIQVIVGTDVEFVSDKMKQMLKDRL
jgi:PTS system N-acetylglucosamine-specific IIC component